MSGDTNSSGDVFVRDRLLGTTERVSVSSAGGESNNESLAPSISADGRYVAFESYATNLVPEDTNGEADIFLRDRLTGITELISVSSSGDHGNRESFYPAMSPDGRYIAFESDASNLVVGDKNNVADVFVRYRLTGTTELVSVNSSGAQGNSGSRFASISADGRYVAFYSTANNLVASDTNGYLDVFVRDRVAGVTERVSVSSIAEQGNAVSKSPSISGDGRYVAFVSDASNLVSGDTGAEDVFVRDRLLGSTECVSIASSGIKGNKASMGFNGISISEDGRFVEFCSYATNLIDGDTNGDWDVYVRDRLLGTTERISVSSSGEQGDLQSYTESIGSISADGRFIAFQSEATNLVSGDTNRDADVFVNQIGSGPGWGDAEVNITGWLQPPDYVGPMPEDVPFEFRNQGETTPFDVRTAIVAPDGAYTVTAYARQMDMSVETLSWLRRTVPVDAGSGPVSWVDMAFEIGDANGNNAVDLYDVNAVFVAYGESGGIADVQGDGVVDLRDLNIIFINFGLVGDP
jgi:Tol biopolymer transport system component